MHDNPQCTLTRLLNHLVHISLKRCWMEVPRWITNVIANRTFDFRSSIWVVHRGNRQQVLNVRAGFIGAPALFDYLYARDAGCGSLESISLPGNKFEESRMRPCIIRVCENKIFILSGSLNSDGASALRKLSQ